MHVLKENLLSKFRITDKVAIPYRPQIDGQVELTNKEIK